MVHYMEYMHFDRANRNIVLKLNLAAHYRLTIKFKKVLSFLARRERNHAICIEVSICSANTHKGLK